MTGDDDTQSGIKSFSVGFNPAAADAPRAIRPAPRYRLLIAGDFGLAEEGRRLGLSGDLAELIGEVRPTVEVSAENLLGSFPVTLLETVSLASLADLKPASIASRFRALSEGADLVAGKSVGADDDRRYERLFALRPDGRPTDAARTARTEDDGEVDDLDSFLRMIDSQAKKPTEPDTPAGLVASFVAENIAPTRAGPKPAAAEGSAAARLLDATRYFKGA
jgi:hypothetical protein